MPRGLNGRPIEYGRAGQRGQAAGGARSTGGNGRGERGLAADAIGHPLPAPRGRGNISQTPPPRALPIPRPRFEDAPRDDDVPAQPPRSEGGGLLVVLLVAGALLVLIVCGGGLAFLFLARTAVREQD